MMLAITLLRDVRTADRQGPIHDHASTAEKCVSAQFVAFIPGGQRVHSKRGEEQQGVCVSLVARQLSVAPVVVVGTMVRWFKIAMLYVRRK